MSNSSMLLCQLVMLVVLVGPSMQSLLRRDLKPEQKEGRVPEMDRLIEKYISTINREHPSDKKMEKILSEAENILKGVEDKEMGQYYVKVLTNIREVGVNFINDERDRLHTILESTKGAEYDFAHYQKNVIEGLVDTAAEDVLRQMRDQTGMDFDMFDNLGDRDEM